MNRQCLQCFPPYVYSRQNDSKAILRELWTDFCSVCCVALIMMSWLWSDKIPPHYLENNLIENSHLKCGRNNNKHSGDISQSLRIKINLSFKFFFQWEMWNEKHSTILFAMKWLHLILLLASVFVFNGNCNYAPAICASSNFSEIDETI